MPRFAANLSMLFTELGFLDRFEVAARVGFQGVEFLFPYAYKPDELAERLVKHRLEQVLFNLPPGNWDNGERGLACLPDRISEFQENVGQAIEYAQVLGCHRLHVMAGRPVGDCDQKVLKTTYVENLRFAAACTAAHGISLLIEPINEFDIPGYFLNNFQLALEIITEVGAENVKIQADIYHLQRMQGELANTILSNISDIGHIQIADTPGRHEPGTGEINYPFLFNVIDGANFQGWIGCEYLPISRTESGLGWLLPYQ